MANDLIKLKDIKPVLYGYVRDARDILDPEVVPDGKKVHDLRVLMKKARAVMKLISPQIDSSFFEREYSAFRETGRICRSWRETAVHRKTLKELKRKYPDILSRVSGNENINRLMQKPAPAGNPSEEMKQDIEKILEVLEKSAYRIRFIKMDNLDPKKLLDRLEAVYSEISEIYLKARNYPKTSNLHEFRKKMKDMLYQLCFFRQLNPNLIRSLEKRLGSMADCLGKHHDLAVLLDAFQYKYEKNRKEKALDELALVIIQEQDRYLSKIWPSAFRIFRPGQRFADVANYVLTEI